MAVISAGRLAVILGVLVALGPLAIDTYLPAIPAIAAYYGVPVPLVETSLSTYMIGTGLGQLIGGPLSDQYGRKPVAWMGLTLFAVASVAITFTESVLQLNALRFIQALGGGATVVIAAASVRDHFDGSSAVRVLTSIGLVMLIAPLLAPAIGSALLHIHHWHLIFYVLAGYAVFLMALLYTALPTVKPVNLNRGFRGVLRGYRAVMGDRRGAGFVIANGLAFACMFSFVTDSAFVYMEHFGVSEATFPIYFGANVFTMITFNRLNVLLIHRYAPLSVLWLGLLLQTSAALMLFVLVWAGLATLWVSVPLIMLAVGGIALVVPNTLASLMHLFPRNSGSATGLSGATQFFMGGVAGYVISHVHDHSLWPMTSVMAVTGVLAVLVLLVSQWGVDQHPTQDQLVEDGSGR